MLLNQNVAAAHGMIPNGHCKGKVKRNTGLLFKRYAAFVAVIAASGWLFMNNCAAEGPYPQEGTNQSFDKCLREMRARLAGTVDEKAHDPQKLCEIAWDLSRGR
jgi:hypothetical protein